MGKTDDAEVAIRCLNPECPATQVARLLHFGGRSALDIEGMGEARVEQLVASGRFDSLADAEKVIVQAEVDRAKAVQADAERSMRIFLGGALLALVLVAFGAGTFLPIGGPEESAALAAGGRAPARPEDVPTIRSARFRRSILNSSRYSCRRLSR